MHEFSEERDLDGRSQENCFAYLGVVRAIAASMVVFNHILLLLVRDYQPGDGFWLKQVYNFAGLAPDAVTVFFVVSGFSIAFSIERRMSKGVWSFGSYLLDRLVRLWVVLVPALLLGGIIDAIGRYGLSRPRYLGEVASAVIDFDVALRLTLENFLGNIAFVQTQLVPPFGSNGPLWSLSNEFWYYIWFPTLLAIPFLRRGWPLALFGFATMILFHSYLIGFGFWLMGALAFHAAKRFQSNRSGAPGSDVHRFGGGLRAFLVVLACSAWLVGILAPRVLGLYGPARLSMVAAGVALSVFAVQACRPSFPSRLSAVARYGALSSFSLYVCHFPLLFLIVSLLAPSQLWQPDAASLAIAAALFPLMILWGWLFSQATEHRTDRVKSFVQERVLRRRIRSALPSG